MILTSYPYAAPPVRLPEPAADGGIRLRLTLRKVDHQGRHVLPGGFTVVTERHAGFSEAQAKLLELATAVRGQLVGGEETVILGALPDFTGAATHQDKVTDTAERKLTSREAARELFVAGYLQALDDVAAALAVPKDAGFLTALRSKAAAVQTAAAIKAATAKGRPMT